MEVQSKLESYLEKNNCISQFEFNFIHFNDVYNILPK